MSARTLGIIVNGITHHMNHNTQVAWSVWRLSVFILIFQMGFLSIYILIYWKEREADEEEGGRGQTVRQDGEGNRRETKMRQGGEGNRRETKSEMGGAEKGKGR